MKRLIKKIMSNFLRGLLALMPLFITVFLVMALFGFIERRVKYFLFLVPEEYRSIPLVAVLTELAAAVLLFILICCMGLAVKTLWGKVVVKRLDRILTSVPGISVIYKATRQFIDLLTMDKEAFLMKPVLVEYPSKGIWGIGFNTGEVKDELVAVKGERCYTVFIPTTPNPTSGFLLIFPESALRPINISVEAAIKMILTGGMVKEDPKAAPGD